MALGLLKSIALSIPFSAQIKISLSEASFPAGWPIDTHRIAICWTALKTYGASIRVYLVLIRPVDPLIQTDIYNH